MIATLRQVWFATALLLAVAQAFLAPTGSRTRAVARLDAERQLQDAVDRRRWLVQAAAPLAVVGLSIAPAFADLDDLDAPTLSEEEQARIKAKMDKLKAQKSTVSKKQSFSQSLKNEKEIEAEMNSRTKIQKRDDLCETRTWLLAELTRQAKSPGRRPVLRLWLTALTL